MQHFLAYAESSDPGSTNLVKILGGAAILGVMALLVAIVTAIARSREHRQAENILVLALFWAVITAGSLIYTAAAELDWSKEYTTRIESGYFDPRDTTDKPKIPWLLWSGLGIAYAGLLTWSMSRTRPPKSPPTSP